jgi:hypothetical protein
MQTVGQATNSGERRPTTAIDAEYHEGGERGAEESGKIAERLVPQKV